MIAATDFFTVDVWTARGLVTHYVLFVIRRSESCSTPDMGLGKAVVAGVGAKMLTCGLVGFLLVFAIIYWLL